MKIFFSAFLKSFPASWLVVVLFLSPFSFANAAPGKEHLDPHHFLEESPTFKQFYSLPVSIRGKFNINDLYVYLAANDPQLVDFLSILPNFSQDGVTYVGMLVSTVGGDPGLSGRGALNVEQFSPTFFGADVPIGNLVQVASLSGVLRMEPSQFGGPLLDISTAETGVRAVQTNCGLRGKGVVVGVVDTGIDVTHPDFYDHSVSLAQSRIEWLWDSFALGSNGNTFQNPTSGTLAPDIIGHGTHVAGIAAGNGYASGGTYAGVAPDSTIIASKVFYKYPVAVSFKNPLTQTCVTQNFLTLTTDQLTVLRGVHFVFQKAGTRPAVANLSLGFWYGPHDDSTVYEKTLDSLSGPSRLIVAAAGNDRLVPGGGGTLRSEGYHASGTLGTALNSTLTWHWRPAESCLPVTPGKPAVIEVIDGWYDLNDDIAVVVQSPNLPGPITFTPPNNRAMNGATWALYNTPRFCDFFHVLWFPTGTRGNFNIVFNGSAGTQCQVGGVHNYPSPWVIRAFRHGTGSFGNGKIDMWNGSTTPGAASMGAFVDGTDDQNDTLRVTGTAANVIAVGSYATRPDPTCSGWNDPVGTLSKFSSWGPTRDGRLKPEVSAPGEVIISTRSSQISTLYGNSTPIPCQNIAPINTSLSPNVAYYLKEQGTSMAAPHVTGLMALLLSQTAGLDYPQAVNVLTATSFGDPSQASSYPNNQWGWGKMRAVCPSVGTPTFTPTPTMVPIPPAPCCSTDKIVVAPGFLLNPQGMALGGTSRAKLYVAAFQRINTNQQFSMPRILVYAYNFANTNILPGNGLPLQSPTWTDPYGLALDASQNHLFVTDSANNFVQKLNVTGWPIPVAANIMTTFGNTGATPLNGPRGVWVDANGAVYVADTGNNRVVVFVESSPGSNSYSMVNSIGTYGNGPGQFISPTGLVVVNNILYVGDTGNHRIMGYPIVGSGPSISFGTPVTVVSSQLACGTEVVPMLMTLGPDGHVYETDQDDTFKVFDPSTTSWTFLHFCGSIGGGNGQFRLPIGIAVDGQNRTYVADNLNNRWQRFMNCQYSVSVNCTPTPTFTDTPTFTPTPTPACCYQAVATWGPTGAGYSFGSIWGMAADHSASCNGTAGPCLYITDTGKNLVYKFDSAGNLVTSWGGAGIGNGLFNSPFGIAVNPAGNFIYVADSGNSCVQVFDSSGGYVTQWGTNGPGNGQFAGLFGVAVDPVNGNVYTTDQIGNGRVQEFLAGSYGYVTQWSVSSGPRGIAVGPTEDVFVVAGGVQKFTASGAPLGQCPVNSYWNLTVDGMGGLFVDAVMSSAAAGIQKFDTNCNVLCQILTTGQNVVPNIGQPVGVAVDGSGAVYASSANMVGKYVLGTCPSGSIKRGSAQKNNSLSGHEDPTPTPGASVTPTPDPKVLVRSVLVAPNVLHGDGTAQLVMGLGRPASAEWDIYDLVGEPVFNRLEQLNSGHNVMAWDGTNDEHQKVASGIYLFRARIWDGKDEKVFTGKIAVVH